MDPRFFFRQIIFIAAVSLVTMFVLLRSELVAEVAYSVEKGRIRALLEAQTRADASGETFSLPASEMTRAVRPAVVAIETETRMADLVDAIEQRHGRELDEDTLRQLLERDAHPTGIGSGFIVDAGAGLVLTNHHVVDGADRIRVQLADGRNVLADVINQDAATDLALLRIDADRLHEVRFGDSMSVRVGDDVYSLGNPFGLSGTVSRGIISATGRWDTHVPMWRTVYRDFLQTDAVINPGNSGGPLVNARGEVVGVNTAIATQTGHYDGVGYAIPASRVLAMLPRLRSGKPIIRGFLGVQATSIRDAQQAATDAGWTESYGVIIDIVVKDSAAKAAGLREGDILAKLDGRPVISNGDLMDRIGPMPPGTDVQLHVWRANSFVDLTATLGERRRDD